MSFLFTHYPPKWFQIKKLFQGHNHFSITATSGFRFVQNNSNTNDKTSERIKIFTMGSMGIAFRPETFF
jgi:hypothetical protein